MPFKDEVCGKVSEDSKVKINVKHNHGGDNIVLSAKLSKYYES